MKKIIVFFIFLLFLIYPQANKTNAENYSFNDIYEEQMESSGANDLDKELPDDVREDLNDIDINGADLNDLKKVTPEKIFGKIFSMVEKEIPECSKSMFSILAVIMLCALVESFKLSLGEKPLSGVVNVIGVLCICTMVIMPIAKNIEVMGKSLKATGNFMLCYVPIMAGIMVASGQAAAATSYNSIMLIINEFIVQITNLALIPVLNLFLSVSVAGALSTKIKLTGICDVFSKIIKWSLGLCMTVFVGVLGIQNVISAAADNAGNKAAKFIISGFVPIVGGALGDAFATVQSCVRTLKTGVGAFFIVGCGFIFLPIIIKCLSFMLSVNVCLAVGEIFDLSAIVSLLKGIAKVLSTMLAFTLCCLFALIVSTVLVLTVGGSA